MEQSSLFRFSPDGKSIIGAGPLPEEITIPAGVLSIEQGALQKQYRLKSVTLPEGLKSIKDSAFANCTKLESINFPDSLEDIGSLFDHNHAQGVFENCKRLTSIVLPPNLHAVGMRAFFDCRQLREVHFRGTCDSISTLAFSNCRTLETISLPSDLRYIGNRAFNRCELLKKIILPKELISIAGKAFLYCSELRTVVMPESLMYFEPSCFNGCTKLARIVIPGNGSTLSSDLRFFLREREELEVFAPELNPSRYPTYLNLRLRLGAFKDFESCSEEVRSANLTYLKKYRKKLYSLIPEYPEIGQYMLREKVISLRDLNDFREVTEKVNDVELTAAFLTYSETCFTAEQKDALFEKEMFADPCSVAEVRKSWKVRYLKDGTVELADYHGQSEDVYVPDHVGNRSVSSIADNCFYNKSILSVYIPQGITRIGNFAFHRCLSLRSVELPDTLLTIGFSAFNQCVALKDIRLPDSVKEIGANCFRFCEHLEHCELSASLESISENAFAGCTALQSIAFPESLSIIKHGAFLQCTSLRELSLPDTITAVQEYTFSDCRSLTSVHLPANLERIGAYAFRCSPKTDCLHVIEFPESLMSIGNDAFVGHTGFKRLVFPDNVSFGGSFPFHPKLRCEYIKIPSTAGLGTIRQILACTDGYDLSPNNPYAKEINGMLICNHSTLLAVSDRFSNPVIIPDIVEHIASNAFKYTRQRMEIVLPSSVKSIDADLFGNCPHVCRIRIPVNTLSIHPDAFDTCSNDLVLEVARNSIAHAIAFDRGMNYILYETDRILPIQPGTVLEKTAGIYQLRIPQYLDFERKYYCILSADNTYELSSMIRKRGGIAVNDLVDEATYVIVDPRFKRKVREYTMIRDRIQNGENIYIITPRIFFHLVNTPYIKPVSEIEP